MELNRNIYGKNPDSAVLRHKNGKWYAIIMVVEKKILGLEEDGNIDILDVKCDPYSGWDDYSNVWIFTGVSYE